MEGTGDHRKFIADCLLLREGGGNQVKFSVNKGVSF